MFGHFAQVAEHGPGFKRAYEEAPTCTSLTRPTLCSLQARVTVAPKATAMWASFEGTLRRKVNLLITKLSMALHLQHQRKITSPMKRERESQTSSFLSAKDLSRIPLMDLA